MLEAAKKTAEFELKCAEDHHLEEVRLAAHAHLHMK